MNRSAAATLILCWLTGMALPAAASIDTVETLIATILEDSGVNEIKCSGKLATQKSFFNGQVCASIDADGPEFRRMWDNFMAGEARFLRVGLIDDWQAGTAWTKGLISKFYEVEGTPMLVYYWTGKRQFSIKYLDYSWNEWQCPEGFAEGLDLVIPGEGGASPLKRRRSPRIRYPDAAIAVDATGVVVVRAIIGIDGKVRDACVSKPHRIPVGFEFAAFDWVKRSRFEPVTVENKPVEVYMEFMVSFGDDEN